MVQLSEELVQLLDDQAATQGVSRSSLIRDLLKRALAEQEAAAVGRRIAEGYERVPPATPDEWGDLRDATDRAAVELLQRLDAEERASGEPPW